MRGSLRRIFLVLFLLLGFIFNSAFLSAQDFISQDNLGNEELTLYVNETKSLPVSKPSRVAVGNPKIADVVNVSEKTILLTGKSVGTTIFVFWDVFGEHSYQLRVLAEDMSGVKRRIDNLLKPLKLKQVHTQSNDEEGKVLLMGTVKSKLEKDSIDLVLGQLKDKTLDLIEIKEDGIVEIEVQLLELSKDATRTLGFSWPGQATATSPLATTVDASEFFKIITWTRAAFSAQVDLLAQEGKARVLSQPKLACLSGKEAELMVGGEKPIFTTSVQSTIGSSTNVDYKEYGIKLKILPTILDKEKVNVVLNVEVSEVGAAEVIGQENAPTAKAYPLTKRNISTELNLKDGQTLAIGGLVKQKSEEDLRKTPGFGDIPVLGMLFRKKSTKEGGGTGERGDIELYVTLTPKIVLDKDTSKQEEELQEEMISSRTKNQEADASNLVKDYIAAIQEQIINSAYYPQDAKELGWEGSVKLSLLITCDGQLKDARIVQSSGYSMLDEAALETVKNQSPYSPFPKEINLEQLRIDVPIVYSKD